MTGENYSDQANPRGLKPAARYVFSQTALVGGRSRLGRVQPAEVALAGCSLLYTRRRGVVSVPSFVCALPCSPPNADRPSWGRLRAGFVNYRPRPQRPRSSRSWQHDLPGYAVSAPRAAAVGRGASLGGRRWFVKIVVATDSFKGTLSSLRAGRAIAEGIRRVLPRACIVVLPVADGGEGTVEAVLHACGGRWDSATVSGPLGEPVEAAFGILPDGRRAVIVGASNLIGKPMSLLLTRHWATVTICDMRTKPLSEMTRQADILVSVTGVAHLITADMVKPGAVVLDFGFARLGDKWVGDVDFEAVKEIAGAITPVPGGTGPMTNAMLMRNTMTAAERQVRLGLKAASQISAVSLTSVSLGDGRGLGTTAQ